MLTGRLSNARRDERGAVTVIFALLLTVMLVIGSLVISVGSWYTHGRQLQTKVDASVLAGGGAWSFPCKPATDTRIASTARLYFGEHTDATNTAVPGVYNQQIGGVEGNDLYLSLNQAQWWDDTFPAADFTSPAGSVCLAKSLEAKATEDDSPLLWGWLPFTPDIKKRAKVQLEEAKDLFGTLPIAVRVPTPVSAAAILFNEDNGTIVDVQYFDPAGGLTGLPTGLEGFSTQLNSSTAVALPAETGVAIALSYLPECGPSVTGDCFEDNHTPGVTTVNQVCNQGARQVVTCYAGTGTWPSRNITTGLHFMRGFPNGNVSNTPPELRGAYLENAPSPANCEANGYFNSFFTGSCRARVTFAVDIGNAGPNRIANNVEVSYKLVRTNGTSDCAAWCPMQPSNPNLNGVVAYQTAGTASSPHALLTTLSEKNAVAIRVRVRNNNVPGHPTCSDPAFNANCVFYQLSSGPPVTAAPSDTAILNSPVQRAYMGSLDLSGPVKWLRVNKDMNCDDAAEVSDGAAATESTTATACYFIDMGLKGGVARDQDEPGFSFVEGSGPSQLGALDCDQTVQLKDAVVQGCNNWYEKNKFNTTPLCPPTNQYHDTPPPFPGDDWPPIDCVKTQTTSAANQLLDGLQERLFNDSSNPSCPAEPPAGGFVPGRNYWHRANNVLPASDATNFAWDNDTPGAPGDDLANRLDPNDPRLVTLFYTPYDSQIGSGNTVWPIVALGQFYITGFARLNGSGGFQNNTLDPCSDGNGQGVGAGNTPPPDLNENGQNSSGVAIWGHFVKPVIQSASSHGSTGNPCDENSPTPCVPVLVE